MAWSLTRVLGKVGTKTLTEIALQGGTQEVEVAAPGKSIAAVAVHHLLEEYEMTAIDVGSIEGVNTTKKAGGDKQRISTSVR